MIRIIIIEDDPSIAEGMLMIFASPSYHATIHNNADRVFQGDYEIPDIFLVDKQLPGIDGLDVCSMLKKRPATQHLPIIILSASPNVYPLAKQAGADEFVEKPFKLQVLKDAVDRLTVK